MTSRRSGHNDRDSCHPRICRGLEHRANAHVCTLPIPWRHKLRGCKSFANAALRGLLVLPPDLLPPSSCHLRCGRLGGAPNRLLRWARWWDNDVSISGDHQVPAHTCRHAPEARATYYAPGHHPRSFHARWIWLGLRNRASALAAMFGRKLTPAEVQDADTWGDETIGKAKEGWCVRRNGPLYQLYIIRKIGPLCLRVHYGHKLNHARIWGRPAMVVNISFSSAVEGGGMNYTRNDDGVIDVLAERVEGCASTWAR